RPRAALAAARFQNVRAVAPQKRALWVWSAVRVALTASPTSLTSLTSSAYSSLVSAGGPSGRKYDGLGMTKGVVVAIVGANPGRPGSSGSPGFAPGRGVGRHLPPSRLPRYGGRGAVKPAALWHARSSLASGSPP